MRFAGSFAVLCLFVGAASADASLRGHVKPGKLHSAVTVSATVDLPAAQKVADAPENEWRYVSTNHPTGKGQVEEPGCGAGKDCRKVAVETGCLGYPCEMKAAVGKVEKEGSMEVVPRSKMEVHRIVHEKPKVKAAPSSCGVEAPCEAAPAAEEEKDVVVTKTAACEDEPCEETVRVETTKEAAPECGDECDKPTKMVVVSTTEVAPCAETEEEEEGSDACGRKAAEKKAAEKAAEAPESTPCECAEGHPDTRCCAKARASVEEHLAAGKVKAVEKLAAEEEKVTAKTADVSTEAEAPESTPCECAEGHPDTRCCAKARASVEEHLVAGKVKAVEKLAAEEEKVTAKTADVSTEAEAPESTPCECAEGHPDTRCCAKARASVEKHLVAGKVKAVEKLAAEEEEVAAAAGAGAECEDCPKNAKHAKALLVAARARVLG